MRTALIRMLTFCLRTTLLNSVDKKKGMPNIHSSGGEVLTISKCFCETEDNRMLHVYMYMHRLVCPSRRSMQLSNNYYCSVDALLGNALIANVNNGTCVSTINPSIHSIYILLIIDTRFCNTLH